MASASHPHRQVFRGFDESAERFLGADLRLIYGMAVPVLMICGLIILLALHPTTWLVIGVLIFEVAALGLVVAALLEMMRDDEDESSPES